MSKLCLPKQTGPGRTIPSAAAFRILNKPELALQLNPPATAEKPTLAVAAKMPQNTQAKGELPREGCRTKKWQAGGAGPHWEQARPLLVQAKEGKGEEEFHFPKRQQVEETESYYPATRTSSPTMTITSRLFLQALIQHNVGVGAPTLQVSQVSTRQLWERIAGVH